MKNSKFPYIVLTPMLLLLVVFIVIPIIGSFVISFMDFNALRTEGNRFVGLENFFHLGRDELFNKAVWNTLYFSIVMTISNLVISLAVAQLLASLRSNGWRNVFRVTAFMPCVAPLAAVAVVWKRCILPVKGGLLNMALGALGVPAVTWMGDNTMLSVMIMTQWADIGYNIVLFIAGIQGIPEVYYEAAEIDGAKAFRRFFHITLPLLNRTFAFVLIMTMISEFQVFTQFAILGSGTGYSALVLSNYIYEQGFVHKDMGYASAISLVLFAIVMLFTLVQKRMTKADWGY